MVILGIKPASGDHESSFKKVGSILCGFNTMGTNLVGLLEYSAPYLHIGIPDMMDSLMRTYKHSHRYSNQIHFIIRTKNVLFNVDENKSKGKNFVIKNLKSKQN